MFKLSTSERFSHWKSFRKSIDGIPTILAIQKTIDFWKPCPFIPFYLDCSRPETWPDPWQLIAENYYCDLAKLLGIVYTLHLTSHKDTLLPEISIYYDYKTRYTYHIAQLCHEKYVINLVDDEILNKQHIDQKLKLKYRYTTADLKLEQY